MLRIGHRHAIARRRHEILRGEAAQRGRKKHGVRTDAIASNHAALRVDLEVHLATAGQLLAPRLDWPAALVGPEAACKLRIGFPHGRRLGEADRSKAGRGKAGKPETGCSDDAEADDLPSQSEDEATHRLPLEAIRAV